MRATFPKPANRPAIMFPALRATFLESNFFLEGNFSKARKPACHNVSRLEGNFFRGKLFCGKPTRCLLQASALCAPKKSACRPFCRPGCARNPLKFLAFSAKTTARQGRQAFDRQVTRKSACHLLCHFCQVRNPLKFLTFSPK